MTTSTATISTIRSVTTAEQSDLRGTAVPPLDRLAMRVGLALLLWGRHHADARRVPVAPRSTLVSDARWYLS